MANGRRARQRYPCTDGPHHTRLVRFGGAAPNCSVVLASPRTVAHTPRRASIKRPRSCFQRRAREYVYRWSPEYSSRLQIEDPRSRCLLEGWPSLPRAPHPIAGREREWNPFSSPRPQSLAPLSPLHTPSVWAARPLLSRHYPLPPKLHTTSAWQATPVPGRMAIAEIDGAQTSTFLDGEGLQELEFSSVPPLLSVPARDFATTTTGEIRERWRLVEA